MKKVYIAGPFRGANAWEIEQNVHTAEVMAAKVCKLGAVAVCPHTMYRNFQGLLPDAFWLNATMELLYMCDGVLVLDGWVDSKGTIAEMKEAKRLDIKVFYFLEDLKVWLGL